MDCINTKPICEILSELNTTLSELYKAVNQRIKSGANKHIKVNIEKDSISWELPYKRDADSADNPYYEKIKTLGMADVIDFVANKTNFYSSLTHLVNKGAKSKVKSEHVKAYLVSQGEAIGHKKQQNRQMLAIDTPEIPLLDNHQELRNKATGKTLYKTFNSPSCTLVPILSTKL